jgi:hypothetical protein
MVRVDQGGAIREPIRRAVEQGEKRPVFPRSLRFVRRGCHRASPRQEFVFQ